MFVNREPYCQIKLTTTGIYRFLVISLSISYILLVIVVQTEIDFHMNNYMLQF